MIGDLDYAIMERREGMQARQRALDYYGGYVADLPHPFQSSTGNIGCCELCDGHYDRRIHDRPWQRPVFGVCRNCENDGDIQCDVCGDTRLSFHRIGVEEMPEPMPPKPLPRRVRWPGSKLKRRKGHWRTRQLPRSTQRQQLRESVR